LIERLYLLWCRRKQGSNQTAENFIEQLIKARRELVGLGCEYITLEDHCKNLLQEAMLQDDRFRDQANAFSAASDVTWKKMTSEVTAREMNETEKQQTTSTSSNSTAPLQHNLVRKLTAIVERHQNRGQGEIVQRQVFQMRQTRAQS
jgi:hypothetical protein